MTYRPIDNGNEFSLGDNPALSSAIEQAVQNNAADMQFFRRQRRGASWHPGPTSQTIATSFVETDLQGYLDPYVLGNNPETIGFQFSTHPGTPMCLPLAFPISAGASELKVRVCMKVENADGDLLAFGLRNGGVAVPDSPVKNLEITGARSGGAFPGAATSCFTSATVASGIANGNYVAVTTTAASNTDGFSFYELTIPLRRAAIGGVDTSVPRIDAISMQNPGGEEVLAPQDIGEVYAVCLCFGSRADQASPTVYNVTDVRYDQKVLLVSTTVPAIAPNGPGKFHELVEVTDGVADLSGGYQDTYHHIMQVRPDSTDPTNPNYGNLDTEFVIYPRVDSTANPATFGPGQTITTYPLTKFTIYSVSIEEV
jgi:hypothetical protein